MTICTAGISKEGIILVSDCRVSYGRTYSDSLQKTCRLTEFSTLSFAGDIRCAKFIITKLNHKNLTSNAKKGAYLLLRHAVKQIRNLYKSYPQCQNCFVSFLLTGFSGSNYWIASCNSPKFDLDIINEPFSVRTIGDTQNARNAVNHSMSSALSSNFTGANLALLAGSAVDGALNLVYFEKDRVNDSGISGVLTLFKVSEAGVENILYGTEMFRGEISDRNKSLGYSKTNSVEFDQTFDRLRVHDHQSEKSNILSNIYSFAEQNRGVINTNFDPFKLKN